MLEALGVVEICKGNGSRIRTSVDTTVMNPLIFQMILQSREESKEKLVEFRKIIEISGSMLAIDKADEADIEKLKKIHEKTKNDFKKGRATVDYQRNRTCRYVSRGYTGYLGFTSYCAFACFCDCSSVSCSTRLWDSCFDYYDDDYGFCTGSGWDASCMDGDCLPVRFSKLWTCQ